MSEHGASDIEVATHEPARSNKRALLGAGIALVLLVGALGYFFVLRPDGTALALKFNSGDTKLFHITISLNGTLSAGGRTVPLDSTSDADAQWKVLSVDAAGTATIQQTISNQSVTAAGNTVPAASSPPVTFQLTKDGRVLAPNGSTLFGGSGDTSMAGSGSFSAVLPDGAVHPGDSWTKNTTVTLFGSTLSLTAHGSYLRDEQVGSSSDAVVRTTASFPVHVTVKMADLAALIPTASTLPAGATMTFSGNDSTATTSWIDSARHVLMKTQSTAQFNYTITGHGFPPGSLPLGGLKMAGTISVDLQST